MKCGTIDISITKEAVLTFYNVMDKTFGFRSCTITTMKVLHAETPTQNIKFPDFFIL